MKEHPIIFSSEMVRADLKGRKCMTRRPIKPQPYYDESLNGVGWIWEGLHHQTESDLKQLIELSDLCPYAIGDILWVRETWIQVHTNSGLIEKAVYKADYKDTDGYYWPSVAEDPKDVKWKPSIHMPRWACRITHTITKVKVERLQEITSEDAEAEGARSYLCQMHDYGNPDYSPSECPSCLTFVKHFEMIWNGLYTKKPEYQWEADPWVWVIEYENKGQGGR